MRTLNEIRKDIDELDEQLIPLLKKRVDLGKEIGEVKKSKGLPVYAPEREKEVLEKVRKLSEENNLNADFVQALYEKIIEHTKREEKADE